MTWLAPTKGWVEGESGIDELDLGGETRLWLKRDDTLESLCGGSKVRKLDVLACHSPWREAGLWHSVGIASSGNLLACALACRELDKTFVAHIIADPSGQRSLVPALKALGAHLEHYRSRAHFVSKAPWLLRARPPGPGEAVVPPGATTAQSTLAMVHAGQASSAEMLERGIRRIYVPVGSGGTALGIAMAMAAHAPSIEVVGVMVVERWVMNRRRLRRLEHDVRQLLRASRENVYSGNAPLSLDLSQLGAGYAQPTVESRRACALFERHSISLDPIYSGKAAAALIADGRPGSLLWVTNQRPPDGVA